MMNEAAKKEHTPLDPDALYAALEEKIRAAGHAMDMGRIRAAYQMASLAHAGQLRKDGSPYVTHCVAAADISVDGGARKRICATRETYTPCWRLSRRATMRPISRA